MEDIVDVIVVGAGLSGISCAIELKKRGMEVIVLERGEYPGSKNSFGGILFTTILKDILPDFRKDAPLERAMAYKDLCFMTDRDAMALQVYSGKWADRETSDSFTVHRAKFDKWYADKASEAGVDIYEGIVVQDFIREKGAVKGVRVRGEKSGEFDEFRSNVVVIAEGSNSMLTERAGLRKGTSLMTPKNRVSAVKEIIEIGEDEVNKRFSVEAGAGKAVSYFGFPNAYMVGIGFLYTNKSTVSVGLGVLVDDLLYRKEPIYDLLERFKAHPIIAPLLKDGNILEYSTHMIAEDSRKHHPGLFDDGIVVVGDAAGLVNMSFHMEATNLAMLSGVYAAKAIKTANEKKDYSRNTLYAYREMIEDSFIKKDLVESDHYMDLLSSDRNFLKKFPEFGLKSMVDFFTPQNISKKEIKKRIFRNLRKEIGLFGALKAAFKARRIVL